MFPVAQTLQVFVWPVVGVIDSERHVSAVVIHFLY